MPNDITNRKSIPAITYFRELERLGIFKRFQADLYLLTGLAFDFADAQARSSLYLRAIEKYIPFCRLVNSVPGGRRACESCARNAIRQCLKTKRDIITTCHLGLVDVFVPIAVNNCVGGVLSTGQFLWSVPTERGFKKIRPNLVKIGMDIKQAQHDYGHIPVIESARVRAIIDIIHMMVDSILAEARKMPILRSASREDKVVQAQEFIESNYTENISVKDVAATVHLSPSRLSHLLKESLNTTFTAYINDVRLHWAKYYLENTTLRVGEIAFRVGFENLSHFNRQFRAKIGLAPRQFRQQISTKK